MKVMTTVIARIDEDNRAVHPALRGRKVIGHVLRADGEWTQLELIGPFYTASNGEVAPVHVWARTASLREPHVSEYEEIYSSMVSCD